MKDIEFIRRKCEEEIRLAEISNAFETKFGVEPIVFSMNKYDVVSVNCDNTLASKILNAYEPTTELELNPMYNNPVNNAYKIASGRGYGDHYSTMTIEFMCGRTEYKLNICIGGNDKIEQFFTGTDRPITDTELSTYHPVGYDGKLDSNMRIPNMTFACNKVARYYGGRQVLLDPDIIDKIISSLKLQ